jgi:hypothetical protein
MKTAPNWHSDLAFGKKYERLAIDLLEDGNVVTPPEGVKFSPWDFKHNGVPYEVKSDRRAADTGNICIEYEHTGIPSGIAITEAMEWIYFVIKKDGYYCYRIPTKDIRERVARDGTLKFYTDAGNSRFYLVPANEFAEYLWKQT